MPMPIEQLLVNRCQRGEQEDWRELCQDYGPGLRRVIAGMLGRHASNGDLVEEILGRVWYKLVAARGMALKRFDPGRGSLAAYLAALVRREVQLHFRELRRRRATTTPLGPDEVVDPRANESILTDVLDYLEHTLSHGQHQFLRDQLLGRSSQQNPCTDYARWKMTERIKQAVHNALELPVANAGTAISRKKRGRQSG
jgi:DNA-directed RNA polymerase specialized sigma24 family protein